MPAIWSNLTVCRQWNGLPSCCNTAVEAPQVDAFNFKKSELGLFLISMRNYLAQMMLRQLTGTYKNEEPAVQAAFDRAMSSLRDATAAYPPCMLALLQYDAGMICFMCEPRWSQSLYRQAPEAAGSVSPVFSPDHRFRSVSVAPEACEALWQGCGRFGALANVAWHAILDSQLARMIYEPLPEMDVYFSKQSLCTWARVQLASRPMGEVHMVTPKPTLPALPPDADNEPGQPQGQATQDHFFGANSRRLSGGLTYLIAAFQQPDEVKTGELNHDGELSLSQHVGGSELGKVLHISVDDTGEQHHLYLAVEEQEGKHQVYEYSYVYVEHSMVIEAPVVVWPSAPDQQETVQSMRTNGGDLFLATGRGLIVKIVKNVLASGARGDGEALYSTKQSSEGLYTQVAGLGVQEALFWATSTEVFAGSRGGSSVAEARTILNSAGFAAMAGNLSVILDIAILGNGTDLFVAVHEGGISQISCIYRLDVLHDSTPVRLTWTSIESKLRIVTGSDVLFVSSPLGIFTAPLRFLHSDVASQVLALGPQSLQTVADISVHFVPGTDCVVSDWQAVFSCSATCGPGTLRQEREILTHPANGGKLCPEDLVRHVGCKLQDCVEIDVDCRMSQWMNDGACSATCGVGEMTQRREVRREAQGIGTKCPTDLTRSISCSVRGCGGTDHVLVAMKLPSGFYQAQVEADLGKALTMMPVSADDFDAVPNLTVADSSQRYLYATNVGGPDVQQWMMSIGDGGFLGVFSPRQVWKAASDDRVAGITLVNGDLFVATKGGIIAKVARDMLTDRAHATEPKVLYRDAGGDSGELRHVSACGTYLLWGTATMVTLGAVDGTDDGVTPPETLLSPEDLGLIAGAEGANIMDLKLQADGGSFLMLVWDQASMSLGLFGAPLKVSSDGGGQMPQQLGYTWQHSSSRLVATPSAGFVYDSGRAWSFPLQFEGDATATEVYNPKTLTEIASITYLFVKGVDCEVTAWKPVGACSNPCGGGVVQEARTVVQEASRGGLPCPELKREAPCNSDPCKVDCEVSEWARAGNCSKPCGGGLVKEVRQVLTPAGHGGIACPELMERQVACNSFPCHGVDCLLTDWMNVGKCSKSCGTGEQRQYRLVLLNDSYGGKPCSASPTNRTIACNPTPCAPTGYDPMEAGRQANFDFDLSDYCESDEPCAIGPIPSGRRLAPHVDLVGVAAGLDSLSQVNAAGSAGHSIGASVLRALVAFFLALANLCSVP